MAKNPDKGTATEPFEIELEIRESIECLKVKPGRKLATLELSDFPMPFPMSASLHTFLITHWTEAMLAWVEENKHLMTVGTKTVKILGDDFEFTGLLFNGDLYGWCTYDNYKATFFKDRPMGRSKFSLIILNYDNSLYFIVIFGYGDKDSTRIGDTNADGYFKTGSKKTVFIKDEITNRVYELGGREGIKLDECYFNRDGLVIRALDKNWASLVDIYKYNQADFDKLLKECEDQIVANYDVERPDDHQTFTLDRAQQTRCCSIQ